MAIKKNELYSSLWASCDQLRGGMDASQYKDYILTLLFVKYVTDKFKGVKYADLSVPEGASFDDMVALKGNKNIGEEIDKIIASLAEANELRDVIDNVHFNDESKLGKGQEMVDKLTKLIGIFQRPEFDFKNNKAGGDDLLGDAYEFLMRKFATESGKSKGQFYTPAEVSRILAKVVGIDKITVRAEGWSVYDPACGSGSLLVRAADEAPVTVSIWGQEKDITTAGLAKMNLVLHNKADGEIKAANTFSDPQYFDEKNEEILKRFDFSVANPPFSLKNWTDGLKEYGRFDGYGDRPPEKNGDFAWLMHILKSLKSTGKAAVILPHGVLFRGNAEATIRKTIIDKGYIKGIIGLPANLFYGTGIPACIIIIDKSDADERQGIFMIDASHDFVKDGNKNRLRERDIHKIVTTFNEQIIDDPKYARFVPNDEIKVKNEYNLNIPRYIDSSTPEDLQDIEAHLHGGIPAVDVESMDKYWALFPELKNKLFSSLREGYYKLNIETDEVRNTVYNDDEFSAYAERIDMAFDAWTAEIDNELRNIDEKVDVKKFVVSLAAKLIAQFDGLELVDKYDVYEVLLSYWQETMADDIYVLKFDGYEAARETENIIEKTVDKKGNEKEKYKGWEGKVIPKALVESAFFSVERKKIDDAQTVVDETQSMLDELIESVEESSMLSDIIEDGKIKIKDVKEQINLIFDALTSDRVEELKKLFDLFPMKKKEYIDYIANHPLCEVAYTEKGTVTKTSIKQAIYEEKNTLNIPELYKEDYNDLLKVQEYLTKITDFSSIIKELNKELDETVRAKYVELTDEEIKELLVNRKWYYTIFDGIKALYVTTSHNMANRISELAERYEDTLPELEEKVNFYSKRVKNHLELLGYNESTPNCLVMEDLMLGKKRLPGFTNEWKDCVIGKMGDFYSGLSGKSKKDFDCGNARFITFLNVLSNVKIDTSSLGTVDVKENESQNKVKKGDLFFNTSSETPEEVGMCAVLDEDIDNTYLNSFCFGFRLNDDRHNPLFLSYYLNSSIGRKIMSVLAQGATRYNLSKNNFAETIIKLPEKEEQTAIATILSDMDNEIEALEQKLVKTRQLKQGMMQQLLTGKIRLV